VAAPLCSLAIALEAGVRERCTRYENEVLEPIAGLHKLGSQVTDGAEDMARGDEHSSYSKA
jgi:hypothetical protein